MNHTVKVIFVALFLLLVTAYLGLILTQTNLANLWGGDESLTGGSVAENCPGDDCPKPVIGCGEERSGYACQIACYADEDCDDSISQTDDICRNPGTVNSLCVNRIRKN